VPLPVRVSLAHDEHVPHPLVHEEHEGPPVEAQRPLLQASPSALNVDAHASNGPMQPWTSTLMFTGDVPASRGTFCPERHRFSERTHVSFARYASAAGRPATLSTSGGGMQPSASTHCPTDAMLVRASKHSSATGCAMPASPVPLPTRNWHSLRPSEKSVSVALESHRPPPRHASQRDVTSAMQAARSEERRVGKEC